MSNSGLFRPWSGGSAIGSENVRQSSGFYEGPSRPVLAKKKRDDRRRAEADPAVSEGVPLRAKVRPDSASPAIHDFETREKGIRVSLQALPKTPLSRTHGAPLSPGTTQRQPAQDLNASKGTIHKQVPPKRDETVLWAPWLPKASTKKKRTASFPRNNITRRRLTESSVNTDPENGMFLQGFVPHAPPIKHRMRNVSPVKIRRKTRHITGPTVVNTKRRNLTYRQKAKAKQKEHVRALKCRSSSYNIKRKTSPIRPRAFPKQGNCKKPNSPLSGISLKIFPKSSGTRGASSTGARSLDPTGYGKTTGQKQVNNKRRPNGSNFKLSRVGGDHIPVSEQNFFERGTHNSNQGTTVYLKPKLKHQYSIEMVVPSMQRKHVNYTFSHWDETDPGTLENVINRRLKKWQDPEGIYGKRNSRVGQEESGVDATGGMSSRKVRREKRVPITAMMVGGGNEGAPKNSCGEYLTESLLSDQLGKALEK